MRPNRSLGTALGQDLPILFAYIGWANRYDGTEPIRGGHAFLKRSPRDNMEMSAFFRDGDGLFSCGVGRGIISAPRLHVVFVARDPADGLRKIVGVYGNARLEQYVRSWMVARAQHAYLLPPRIRPRVAVWPGGQGMRRWASRDGMPGPAHGALLRQFNRLKRLRPPLIQNSSDPGLDDQVFEDIEALEGREERRLVVHRRREARLRRGKIRAVLNHEGMLRCEVSGCGFDFQRRYGVLGENYAHVHHKTPLRSAGRRGRRVTLSELAIVCANCHAMIHRGGACRPLRGLIRRARRR